MNIYDILDKSQKKIKLSKSEIFWLVDQFTKELVPDYQISTWLGTVFLNQLSEEETSFLTEALCNSGEKLTWSMATVDKHSTGGVGDKTSIIIAPLVASLGYSVPMMAGRGLGHTGGTIDKLESIGLRTNYDVKKFKNLVEKNGVCIMGQSENFCPADKRLYALRDATHTVANVPLICSSIMSKKIAEGLKGLVLDVKFGTGAFMNQLEDAKSLAKKLINIGQANQIKTYGVLSSMNQPLGRYVGNKLEVLECLEILRNPEDVFEKYEDNIVLSLLISALMLTSINPESKLKNNFQKVYDQLFSGKAFLKFVEIVETQEGNLSDFFKTKNSYESGNIESQIDAQKLTITADNPGHMNYIDVKELGFASVALGAGRQTQEDTLDLDVGFYCYKKQGELVKKSENLFDIFYNDEAKLKACLEKLNLGFQIKPDKQLKDFETLEHFQFGDLINEVLAFDGKDYLNVHLKTDFFEF